jgi:hypothetical protein
LFILLQQSKGKIAALEEEQQRTIDRLGGLISCLQKSDNSHLPGSSYYMDYLMGVLKRRKEEKDNEDVEELNVGSKKGRIEKECFSPLPLLPSSSSSFSNKTKPVLTSIHKDVGVEEKRRWRHLCKIPGITEAKKQNLGKEWYTEHYLPSYHLKIDLFSSSSTSNPIIVSSPSFSPLSRPSSFSSSSKSNSIFKFEF